MLPVVHEANRNEFSAALAFKLPLLKTHILSPDSHGRSRVKLFPYPDIVGIRKHIHSQLRQVPSPYSALLELFRQVTNPVGYHMPIMIHRIIVTSSSHYFAINIGFVYAVSYLDYPQGKGSLLFVVIYCSSSEPVHG